MAIRPSVPISTDARQASPPVPLVLGGDRDASADENSRLLSTRFLFGALRPDRMLLQLIQDFGRADRHDVGVPPTGCRLQVALRRRNSIGSSGGAVQISSTCTSSAVMGCMVP